MRRLLQYLLVFIVGYHSLNRCTYILYVIKVKILYFVNKVRQKSVAFMFCSVFFIYSITQNCFQYPGFSIITFLSISVDILVVLILIALWHREVISSRRRQVAFLCWMQDLKHGSLRHQIASRLNAHSQTDWAEDQDKTLNSTTRPYDECAFSPFDFTAGTGSRLALAIYIFAVLIYYTQLSIDIYIHIYTFWT